MFSAFIRRATSVKARIPFLKDIHLNFIFLHYTYLISMTMLTSIIIFPGSQLAYIDALFFSAGAATQSGLNTVDFNLLRTYQQVVLYFISMFTTPIFIHTVLVFVRLYWFEKRFQHVVRDARTLRQTRTRARTATKDADGEGAYSQAEMGVGSRPIVMLQNPLTGNRARNPPRNQASPEDSSSTAGSPTESPQTRTESENTSDDPGSGPETRPGLGLPAGLRVPSQLGSEHHIAFLENQRRNKGALRIPSPREYDRGGVPEVVEEEDGEDLHKRMSKESGYPQRRDTVEPSSPVGPLEGPHITINEPEINRTKTRNETFPRMDSRPTVRETKESPEEEPSFLDRVRSRRATVTSIFRSITYERDRPTLPYLSWDATVARNSNFVDLTEEQRDELGGIEYRALKTLAVVLISYYLCFHILGIICLVPWIMTTHWGAVVEQAGQGRPWWGIFTAASSFNDVGFTLTPDSMQSFQEAIFPLLLMSFLIVIGNTGFPCMLRLIIWAVSKVVRRETALWEELKFLLDHPRRCFTLLFPRNATWWLFAILIALNGIDLIFFIILDINDPAVTSLPPGIRVLDGFFQAVSTRTAGFAVVNLAELHPAVQVSYLIMMYISVFPIAISMRRTNVYEEKSLGVYGNDEEVHEDQHTPPSFIGAHLRKQLSFDLWYVFLGLFIIAIVEGPRLENHADYAFQLWTVLFEVVSAYGTVGMSLGYPGINASFCAEFQPLSKLVIIAMQVRGRHRGLPYSLDRAILLPSEALNKKEDTDAERRMRRRASNISQMTMDRPPTQSHTEGVSTGFDWDQGAAAVGNNSQMNGDVMLNRQSTVRSQSIRSPR